MFLKDRIVKVCCDFYCCIRMYLELTSFVLPLLTLMHQGPVDKDLSRTHMYQSTQDPSVVLWIYVDIDRFFRRGQCDGTRQMTW